MSEKKEPKPRQKPPQTGKPQKTEPGGAPERPIQPFK